MRESLKAIQESLEKICSKIDAATSEYHSRENAKIDLPITVRVLRTPEVTANEEIAANARGRAEERDRKRLKIEEVALWVGSIVALANVGLWIQTCNSTNVAKIAAIAAQKSAAASERQAQASAAQVDATKQSIQATVDNFRIDQRPYLAQSVNSTESPQFVNDPSGTVQITWNWHITNYGKTPANNVSFTQEIKLGDVPFVQSQGEKGRSVSPPIPPGQNVFDTVISKPISKNEYSRLLNMNQGISIRVKVQYSDVTGTVYESGLCLTRTNAGSIPYCKNDNYIK